MKIKSIKHRMSNIKLLFKSLRERGLGKFLNLNVFWYFCISIFIYCLGFFLKEKKTNLIDSSGSRGNIYKYIFFQCYRFLIV